MRIAAVVFAGLVLVAGVSLAWFWADLHEALLAPKAPLGAPPIVLRFEATESPAAVWRQLVEGGVAKDDAVLERFFEGLAAPRRFPAGEVSLSAGEPILRQMERVAAGDVVTYTVNLGAGASTEAIGKQLEDAEIVDAEAFVDAVRRHDAARLRGIEAETLDGFLFPDVYAFPHRTSAEAVVDAMVERFFEALEPADWAAAARKKLDVARWVRLAALLQQSDVPSDIWRLHAALLRNRRRQGFSWEPQAGTGEGPVAVHGLERAPRAWPRPAVNPGLAALRAAARPAESDSLYLVRSANGEYVYSVDLEGLEEAMGIQRSVPRLPP